MRAACIHGGGQCGGKVRSPRRPQPCPRSTLLSTIMATLRSWWKKQRSPVGSRYQSQWIGSGPASSCSAAHASSQGVATILVVCVWSAGGARHRRRTAGSCASRLHRNTAALWTCVPVKSARTTPSRSPLMPRSICAPNAHYSCEDTCLYVLSLSIDRTLRSHVLRT
jgi:hypothetical protein